MHALGIPISPLGLWVAEGGWLGQKFLCGKEQQEEEQQFG